jgi:tRNA threonylcarbamoyl adenosine modification protein YjeE
MTAIWHHPCVDEAMLARLAELVSAILRRGDVITLQGDLGAGKTTFARAVLRAFLGEAALEVPSPTFTLVNTYENGRLPIAHFDLYRLETDADVRELGLEEAVACGVVLIEWPERARPLLPGDRLDVRITETADPDMRTIDFEGTGRWEERVARLSAAEGFLRASGWWPCQFSYVQGDASTRQYVRVRYQGRSAILMDAPRRPDGPPVRDCGLPYSRIAHLSEEVRPYVAIARSLREAGLAAPDLYAGDLERGLLLLEDLGEAVFDRAIGTGASQAELWSAAVGVLVHLRGIPVPDDLPVGDGSFHRLPNYDRSALEIEVALLLDWYWPCRHGTPAPAPIRAEFLRLWNEVFDALLVLPTGWVLRDFHSPNLMWLAHRSGLQRVGVLDFQDAVCGHAAYDLVSLLQDARVDVSGELETALFDRYCLSAASRKPGFDRDVFALAYAAFGAQRNTKILGIFARLARRDGKYQYLQHLPRIWGYLERDLNHSRLTSLRRWYESHFSEMLRGSRDG